MGQRLNPENPKTMTRIIIRIETKQGRTRHEIEDSKTIAEIEAMLGYTIHKINGSSVLREPLSNGDLLTASLRDATTIDSFLSAQSGLIQRSASSLCNHNSNSMCEYCCPLDPFNQVYLSEKKIKFLSFYSFLKKQSLPSYSLSVKQCSAHLPYPKGLCSKCQPSAVTLESQVFRMVDHVEFDEVMVDAFISGWRDTGLQRYGVLYGRYESYDVVPLGIKGMFKHCFLKALAFFFLQII